MRSHPRELPNTSGSGSSSRFLAHRWRTADSHYRRDSSWYPWRTTILFFQELGKLTCIRAYQFDLCLIGFLQSRSSIVFNKS
jgi:hypothetical protein